MEFIKGMDVSMLKELEDMGATYFYKKKQKDIFEIFSETGVNAVRLRIWNDPFSGSGEPYGGGTNDIDTTILLAKRIVKNKIDFIVDFHYSDFWTDPSKQIKPKAWKNLTGHELEKKVYEYTTKTLQTLKDNSIAVKYVQVGNEITNGFMWPEGHIDNLEGMVSLLQAGIQAVKEFDSSIKVILHLDFGTDNALYREWFGKIDPYNLNYDIIGMSYYPYWNGSLDELLLNMNDISDRFQKDIIVAETAFGYTTDCLGCNGMIFAEELARKVSYPATKEGQKYFMESLMKAIKKVKGNRGIGFIYWEPAWLPIPECTWAKPAGCEYINDSGEIGNSWANQALFDEGGNTNPVFEIFNNY